MDRGLLELENFEMHVCKNYEAMADAFHVGHRVAQRL